jgi:hypothetical protein
MKKIYKVYRSRNKIVCIDVRTIQKYSQKTKISISILKKYLAKLPDTKRKYTISTESL